MQMFGFSLASPVWKLLAAASATWLIHAWRAYRRLRHFPGPRLAGWTRIPMILWHLGGKAHLEFGRISEAYGEVHE